MELSKVYSEAMKYAEKLKQRRPQFANRNAAILINAKNEVFAGVAGTMNQGGVTVEMPAEKAALMIMKNGGCTVATNIVVFNLGSGEIMMPSAECLELMMIVSPENENCMVCLGRNDEMPLSALRAPVAEADKQMREKQAAKAAEPHYSDEDYEPMEEIRFADLDAKAENKPEAVTEVPAEEQAEQSEPEAAEEKPVEQEETAEEVSAAEETAEEEPVEEEVTEEDQAQAETPKQAEEEQQPEPAAEEDTSGDEAVDKALDAIDAFMDGFDFDMPEEPVQLTPEEEARALEEKKARQRAAAEAVEKKLAQKAAAEAAKKAESISGVEIAEDNPFFEATADVKPPEEVLAVMSEVQEEFDKSLNPEDDENAPQEPMLTPEELLKQAKRRKKVAKSNFLFRKRM